jgi:hypothetical protein
MVYYFNNRTGEYIVSSYHGLGNVLAYAWFSALLLAGGLFVLKLVRSWRLSALPAALLLNVLFNFTLHMSYGDDPILYSPNWTYAVVFFFGISMERLADKKWFQTALLIFLVALVINNLRSLQKILEAILPFYS